MYDIFVLPNVSSLGVQVFGSPQRVYVEDTNSDEEGSSSLFVSFTESSHGIQCASAAVRGTGLLLTSAEMAG